MPVIAIYLVSVFNLHVFLYFIFFTTLFSQDNLFDFLGTSFLRTIIFCKIIHNAFFWLIIIVQGFPFISISQKFNFIQEPCKPIYRLMKIIRKFLKELQLLLNVNFFTIFFFDTMILSENLPRRTFMRNHENIKHFSIKVPRTEIYIFVQFRARYFSGAES